MLGPSAWTTAGKLAIQGSSDYPALQPPTDAPVHLMLDSFEATLPVAPQDGSNVLITCRIFIFQIVWIERFETLELNDPSAFTKIQFLVRPDPGNKDHDQNMLTYHQLEQGLL